LEANAKDKADEGKKSDKKDDTHKSSKETDKKEQDKKSDKNKDKDLDKTKEKSDKDKKKDKKDSDKPKKVTFTTKPGVVTEDIAEILYDKNVIDDKRKFEDYLEDNDHSAYIQIGTFEVTTDMSFNEIAEVITTYPGSN